MLNLSDLRNYPGDWSPILEHMIATSKGEEIILPIGRLSCSRRLVIPNGTILRGSGGAGCNLLQGTALFFSSDKADTFITMDGSIDYMGGGCGLKNVQIARAANTYGGIGLAMVGMRGKNVASFGVLEDVTFYSGAGAGNFETGILLDGTAITTQGAAGVRDCSFRGGVFVSGCLRRALSVRNAVHLYGEVQTLAGAGGCGDVFVGDDSEDIELRGSCWGNLVVEKCSTFRWLGLATGNITFTAQSKGFWAPYYNIRTS